MAVKRASIEFVEVREPITEPVTKFGGQPVWLEEPQWPLSRTSGSPMRFICQIALDPELFGTIPGRMAYLFMTYELEEDPSDTFDPEAGENAIIIRPGDEPRVETKALESGPTLFKMVQKPGAKLLEPELCEFAVRLTREEDPDFVPESELYGGPESEQPAWNEEERERYHARLSGNKIGGTPGFMQGDEFPSRGPWKLLLQLDSTQVPFDVNFGDAGIGYAFISEDGRSGRFLWQGA